jgi:hypothetical protein
VRWSAVEMVVIQPPISNVRRARLGLHVMAQLQLNALPDHGPQNRRAPVRSALPVSSELHQGLAVKTPHAKYVLMDIIKMKKDRPAVTNVLITRIK